MFNISYAQFIIVSYNQPKLSLCALWNTMAMTFSSNSTTGDIPSGVFVDRNWNIYIDNGKFNRVDKWIVNSVNSVLVMNISNSCFGLFIDINNILYCSAEIIHQVFKTSLNINGTVASPVAGNGSNGSESWMLSKPRRIYVDENFSLYVADRDNHRIQCFTFGQFNGTTIVGNGAPGTIILKQPAAVVFDADNYIFIVDSNNDRIVGSGPDRF